MTPQTRRVILGLLAIVKVAIPDTYYETDPRVKRALSLLEKDPLGHNCAAVEAELQRLRQMKTPLPDCVSAVFHSKYAVGEREAFDGTRPAPPSRITRRTRDGH